MVCRNSGGCMSGEVEEKFKVCDWRIVKVS